MSPDATTGPGSSLFTVLVILGLRYDKLSRYQRPNNKTEASPASPALCTVGGGAPPPRGRKYCCGGGVVLPPADTASRGLTLASSFRVLTCTSSLVERNQVLAQAPGENRAARGCGDGRSAPQAPTHLTTIRGFGPPQENPRRW